MQTETRWTKWIARLAAGLVAVLMAAPALAAPIEWVTVGSPNASKDNTGFGAVEYEYQISKYETTNAQYVEFLNGVAGKEDAYGLYHVAMTGSPHGGIIRHGSQGAFTYSVKSGMGHKPVNWVSFYDVLRFANWLNNGGASGDTENGAYALGGINPFDVVRNPDAKFFLPSEDEWYKAAYFDAVAETFLDYPVGTDLSPICGAPDQEGTQANCDGILESLIEVGSYAPASPSGTHDQAGNVFEWVHSESPVLRGGDYMNPAAVYARSSRRVGLPSGEWSNSNGGFRIAAAVVPEPGTGLLVLTGLVSLRFVRTDRRYLRRL